MTFSKFALVMVGAFCMTQAHAVDSKTIEAFPKASEGQVRYVISLPEIATENDAKVELIVGKTMEVDCNRHFFGGEIKEKDLEGWGYNYYEVSELKGPMGTRMGCMDNAKKEEFVTLQPQPLLRYNSKLPIVVYAPKDVVVKYRIWQADVLTLTAEEK